MKSIYYYLVFLFLFFALLTAGCVNITIPKGDDAGNDNADKDEVSVEPPTDPDTPPPLPD